MKRSEMADSPILSGCAELQDGADTLRAAARRLRALRRERERHFPAELASGPAWDLLLGLDGEAEPDTDSPLSPATRHRWLRILSENGLVAMNGDQPASARLSAAGRARMDGYLTACLEQGLL